MKCRTMLTAVLLAAWLVAGGSKVFGQLLITITVDENGNGHLTNTNGFNGALPSALLPDPGPGGLPLALTYGLLNPPGLVAGDLILNEPDDETVSDLIRFNPQQNGGSLVFYSDNLDGADAPADTGFPAVFYTNLLIHDEIGPEGNNGFLYTPLAGQPGFVAGAAGPVTYVIISDGVLPEPASLGIIGLGVASLLSGRRNRRSQIKV